jgi:uncharacterized protein YpmB
MQKIQKIIAIVLVLFLVFMTTSLTVYAESNNKIIMETKCNSISLQNPA